MKKKILSAFLLCFISVEAFSAPILYVTRSRKCQNFIGCDNVTRTVETVTQHLPDGSTYSYNIGRINCTGAGFNSCPTTWNSTLSGTLTDQTACDFLTELAITQIEVHNISSGVHVTNYYDNELQATYSYTVTWSINALDEQIIQVDKVLFPL
jgi:hypothetical protein